MNALGHITVFIIVAVLATLSSILGVYILLSIANLYSLSFITQFSFAQIYGGWIVLGILSYKHKETKEEADDDVYIKAINRAFSTAFYYLVAWGVAFLMFSILK